MAGITSDISQAVGKDCTVSASIPVYNYWNGPFVNGMFSTDNIPAGTDLGICEDYANPVLSGVIGNSWLQFPGPITTVNGNTVTDFWVQYVPAITTNDGSDISPQGGAANAVANAFGGIGTIVIIGLVLAAIVAGFFIYIKFGKK